MEKNKPKSLEAFRKKLRNLPAYKELTEEEFNCKSEESYNKKYINVLSQPVENTGVIENDIGIWGNQQEADEAKKLYDTYIEKNNLTNFSDLASLKTLIYYEIQIKSLQRLIQGKIKEFEEKNKTYIPTKEIDTINQINIQVLALKRILGLAEEKKIDDPLEKWNLLENKAEIWRKERNPLSRTLFLPAYCPVCKTIKDFQVLLKIRTEIWDAGQHPFYKDRILCNPHLWDLYKAGTITKLDIAKVLFGDNHIKFAYYIDWLEKRIYNIEENKDPIIEEKTE